MAKYKLYKSIKKEKIKSFLAPSIEGFFDESIIKEDSVTVAVFSSKRSEVVLSGHVKQLLKHKDKLNPLVVVGFTFTIEAAETIRSLTPYFFYYDDHTWDDQTYIKIKQGLPLY
jgi:hypothetical protein